VAGSGAVLLEVDGGVAIVTLNAQDRRNALPAMADELIATFDGGDAKPEVGALVVRAVGKSFCAGGDIATLTSAGKDPAAPADYEGAFGLTRLQDSHSSSTFAKETCLHCRCPCERQLR
jgi:enoyl-CoA hydratase/carnithine racemase